MDWFDYLPLLIPLDAIAAIAYTVTLEKPRRTLAVKKPQASAPAHSSPSSIAKDTDHPRPSPVTRRAIEQLEAAVASETLPSSSDLNSWLKVIAEDGGPDELRRLSLVPPKRLHPLGNAPAWLFRAMERAEGETRSVIANQREAVLDLSATHRLREVWGSLARGGPERISPHDERLEVLAGRDATGVVPHILAELADRDADPNWRAVRLDLLGWMEEFNPDWPPADRALEWLMQGMSSGHERELTAAVSAFPGLAACHWFDPSEKEAAWLRDRAIALAATPLALNRELSADLADGLNELAELTHVDEAPVHNALFDHLADAADKPVPANLWAAAQEVMRHGAALVRTERFAYVAVEAHPQNALVSASALLALEESLGTLRQRQVPQTNAELVVSALLVQAPEEVVSRLVGLLEGTLEITPEWHKRPLGRQSLSQGANRDDLSADLVERLCALVDALPAV